MNGYGSMTKIAVTVAPKARARAPALSMAASEVAEPSTGTMMCLNMLGSFKVAGWVFLIAF